MLNKRPYIRIFGQTESLHHYYITQLLSLMKCPLKVRVTQAPLSKVLELFLVPLLTDLIQHVS